MKGTEILARILAVIASFVLFLLLAFMLGGWELSAPIVFTLRIAAYAGAGIVFGLLWPGIGWRLGPYLFTVWFLYILGLFFFTDHPSGIKWEQTILVVFALLVILPAAIFGAWLGSKIRRKASTTSVRLENPSPRS